MLPYKTEVFAAPAHQIHAQCFSRPWSESEFCTLLKLPSSRLWIDETSLLLCAHILDEMEILTLGVIPEERRKGKAHELLTHLFQYAQAHQVKHIFLEVAENNQAARCLYEKRGFVLMGRRPKYYERGTIDALTYQKVL